MTGPKRYKLCKGCGESKSVDEFYRRKTGYYEALCKPCDIADVARRKSAKRAEARAALLALPQLPPPTEKRCITCNQVKPIGRFAVHSNGRRRGQCDDCRKEYLRQYHAHPERRAHISADRKAYAAQHPEQQRAKRFTRYGLTPEQYDALYDAQQGRCAICGVHKDRAGVGDVGGGNVLCIDHDHETGAIRGLLCTGCNTGLGSFGDDPANLIAALDYLQQGESRA